MVGLIAALQSTAAAFLMSSGSIITRDLYKAYVNKNLTWEKERSVARIIHDVNIFSFTLFSNIC